MKRFKIQGIVLIIIVGLAKSDIGKHFMQARFFRTSFEVTFRCLPCETRGLHDHKAWAVVRAYSLLRPILSNCVIEGI